MRIIDANLLIFAADSASEFHQGARGWLDRVYLEDDLVGLPRVVLLAFIRIVTNPRIMRVPASPQAALDRAEALVTHPKSIIVEAGANHWQVFSSVVTQSGVFGPSITDAYLASLAIEHGYVLCSHDEGFRRFASLKFENPLSTRG